MDHGIDPLIASSARRHGVSDEAMLHAFSRPLDVFDQDDGVTMLGGPDHSGTLIEIGAIDSVDGPVIIHALRPARRKYLR